MGANSSKYRRGGPIWIVGGGRFGRRAAEILRRRRPGAAIVVIERSIAVCRELEREGVTALCADGPAYLDRCLDRRAPAGWVVAAVPFHFAYAWLKRRLSREGRFRAAALPAAVWRELPHPIRLGPGRAVASHAAFICPPDCAEPARWCTVTGRPRPSDLCAHIRRAASGRIAAVVLRSRQLAPGVGAVAVSALHAAVDRVREAQGPVLLATACRCHAALTCFHFTRRE